VFGRKSIESMAEKTALAFLAMYTIFFCLLGALRYHFFDFGDQDFAIYAQSMWSLLHGSTFCSILGISFLGNHTDLILFFLLPLYFFIKTPVFLLVLQAVAVGFSGYLLYRLARRELNNLWALLVVVMFLTYPPLAYSHYYEFHPVALAMPFLILCFLTYQEGKWKGFLWCAFFAMMCKENIPLVIAMFSVLALCDRKSLRWILTPAILGGLFFIFTVFFVKPHFNQGTMNFFMRYYEFGTTSKEVFLNILFSPAKTFTTICSPENFRFANHLFFGVAYLSLLSLKTLIPAVTLFLEHFLLSGQYALVGHNIIFHYAFLFVPFIFISAIYGLKRLLFLNMFKKIGFPARACLAIFLVETCILANINEGNPSIKLVKKIFSFQEQERQRNQQFIDEIGQSDKVVATFKFLPKLSNRKELYSFHHIYRGLYTLSLKPYPVPPMLSYALIDFGDDFTFSSWRSGSDERFKKFFDSYGWEVVGFSGETVLFKSSKEKNFKELFEILSRDPRIDIRVEKMINQEIELLGFSRDKETVREGEAPFSFYWKCLKDFPKKYNAFLTLEDKKGKVVKNSKRNICYRLYPTNAWRQGQIIKENYRYIFPSNMPEGEYSLKLSIVEEGKETAEKTQSTNQRELDLKNAVMLFGPEERL